MSDKEQSIANDDVILRVRYTTVVRWVMLLLFAALLVLFVSTFCDCIRRESYRHALVLGLGGLVFYAVLIDNLFVQHILFYRDRVVKVWYGIGRRTIPYSRAKFKVLSPWWRSYWGVSEENKAFSINEVNEAGKERLFQIPITYCHLCVSTETGRKVEAIISSLVGMDDRRKLYYESRPFAGSTLPEDVLYREQQRWEHELAGIRNNLREVARLQRQLLWTTLASCVLLFAGVFLLLTMTTALPVLVALAVPFQFYGVNGLARALQYSGVKKAKYLLATCSPLLPLIALVAGKFGAFGPQVAPKEVFLWTILGSGLTPLISMRFIWTLNAQATRFLREHGITVGFMGVRRSDLA